MTATLGPGEDNERKKIIIVETARRSGRSIYSECTGLIPGEFFNIKVTARPSRPLECHLHSPALTLRCENCHRSETISAAVILQSIIGRSLSDGILFPDTRMRVLAEEGSDRSLVPHAINGLPHRPLAIQTLLFYHRLVAKRCESTVHRRALFTGMRAF